MKFTIRPAKREDCIGIYNLKRQQSIHANMGEIPHLSAQELERDGFDTSPPLYHCLVAVITEEEDMNEMVQVQKINQQGTSSSEHQNNGPNHSPNEYLSIHPRNNEVVIDLTSSSSSSTTSARLQLQLPCCDNNNARNSSDDLIIVGYGLYYVCYPVWLGKAIFLEEICISSKYAGTGFGVGERILSELANIALKGNFVDIRLECLNTNETEINLYERNLGADYTLKEQWQQFMFDNESLKNLSNYS